MLVGLAIVLLRFGRGNAASVAFAVFLVLRAVTNALTPIGVTSGAAYPVSIRFWPPFLMSLSWATLALLAVYPRRRLAPRCVGALVGVGLAMSVMTFVFPSWYWSPEPFAPGPLYAFAFTVFPVYAFAGLVFARDLLREPVGPLRSSLFLVSLGFVALVAFEMSRAVTSGAVVDIPVPSHAAISGVAVALVAATLVGLRGTTSERRRYVTAVAAALSCGVFIPLVPDPGFRTDLSVAAGLVWRLAMPALVTYGLLRHSLFGVDLKVRATVRRGAVAAMFLAVFFVVTEIAQNWLQQYGVVAGGVAAGLLLFALAPLQRLAERFAAQAVPDARAVENMAEAERHHLYSGLLHAAWADGRLDPGERRMLESARRQLGIAAEKALELEAAANG